MATPTRMTGPAQLSGSATTLYTAPANGASIKHLHVSNPSGTAATFTMSIGLASSAGNRLYDAVSIPAGGSIDKFVLYNLNSGDIIQAFSGTANVLVFELDGTEG